MKHSSVLQSLLLTVLTCVGSLALPQPASAQYLGNNFHGDFGVNSGTQAGPGILCRLSVCAMERRPHQGRRWQHSRGLSVPGSRYASDVSDDHRRDATRKCSAPTTGSWWRCPSRPSAPNARSRNPLSRSWGLNDMYVVPLYLGWHAPRADFVAGYGFYAPTGRYEAGADDNVGLGMWSQEIQAGTTVYLDAAKKVSAATTAYLELHSNKKDQDLKVGNLLTLEGGAAYNVPKIGGAFGVGYYFQSKLSNDTGADVPVSLLQALNLYGKNRLFGIGPDVTMAVFQKWRHDRPRECALSLGIGRGKHVSGRHVPHCVHHRPAQDQLIKAADDARRGNRVFPLLHRRKDCSTGRGRCRMSS